VYGFGKNNQIQMHSSFVTNLKNLQNQIAFLQMNFIL